MVMTGGSRRLRDGSVPFTTSTTLVTSDASPPLCNHHRTPKQKPQNRTGGFDEQEGDEVGLELGDGGAHGSGGDGEVEDELLGAGEAAPRAGVALAELEPGLGEDLRAARDAGGGEERGEKEGGEDGAGRRHDGGGRGVEGIAE